MTMNTTYAATEPSRPTSTPTGPTLVEFGAPWCGYCQAAQPALAAALADHPGFHHPQDRGRPGPPRSGARSASSCGPRWWCCATAARWRWSRPSAQREIATPWLRRPAESRCCGRRPPAAPCARSWPQPPSTSCPAEWRSLASTPRRLSVVRHRRRPLPRRPRVAQALGRVVRDQCSSRAYLPDSRSHHALEFVVAVVDAFAAASTGTGSGSRWRGRSVRPPPPGRPGRTAARAAAARARRSARVVCSDSASAGFTRGVRQALEHARVAHRREHQVLVADAAFRAEQLDGLEHVVEVVRGLAHAHEHHLASPAARGAPAPPAPRSRRCPPAAAARRGRSCRTGSPRRSPPAWRRTARRAAAARSTVWPPASSTSRRAEPSSAGCSSEPAQRPLELGHQFRQQRAHRGPAGSPPACGGRSTGPARWTTAAAHGARGTASRHARAGGLGSGRCAWESMETVYRCRQLALERGGCPCRCHT